MKTNRPKKSPDDFKILSSDDLPYTDDDVLLPRTPDDVLAVLGFDPLEFEKMPTANSRKVKP